MKESPMIRIMSDSDVDSAVKIHLAAFRGFFLSFLGRRFLELYYRSGIRYNEILLVATENERIVGFVMGSMAPGRFFRNLLMRHTVSFALAAAPAVIKRPSVALRVMRAMQKPKQATRPLATATLLSIGVEPGSQRSGVGRKLVMAFNKVAQRHGALRVDLTTDKVNNEKVNEFYRSLGFVIAREIKTPENRVLNEYELDLPT